jgi:magnesium-transporting ATPase (P-type)
MKLLALTHECVIEEGATSDGTFYQGPSPDEIELVKFAKEAGFRFSKVSKSFIEIEVKRELEDFADPNVILPLDKFGFEQSQFVKKKFEMLRRMEFTSDRKRMSVLVIDPDDGLLKLYCKGADNVIM